MDDVRAGAAVAWVIGAMCWRWELHQCRDDEREGLLIRTLANVTRPAAQGRRQEAALRATLPLHRVR